MPNPTHLETIYNISHTKSACPCGIQLEKKEHSLEWARWSETEKTKQPQTPSIKLHKWPFSLYPQPLGHCTPTRVQSKKISSILLKVYFLLITRTKVNTHLKQFFAAYFSVLFIKSDAPLKCTVKITTVNSTTAEYYFNKILLPTDVKIHSIVIQNSIQLEDKLTNTLLIQQVFTTP